ncbi:MAG: hypothetical protein V1809_08555 [Planctomycetota bacterium]
MKRLFHNESGQALTEYAITTFFCMVILLGLTQQMANAFARYYDSIATLVALPIP